MASIRHIGCGRTEKNSSNLMDMAIHFGRHERANGRLDDMEVFDEITLLC